MKKKLFATLLILSMCLGLAACGSSSAGSDSSRSDKKTEKSSDDKKKDKKEEPKEYGVGDTWTVDGKFSFTFTSAALTDDRNEFDDSAPAQVVLLTYDYENVGFEGLMDLYFGDSDFKVIDEGGVVASSYPLAISNYPQETPAGAKCTGAQTAYGLKTESSAITITVSQIDNEFNEEKATFKLALQ